MAAYCTREDVEMVYGAANVRKWADLDNDDDATVISDRISWACDLATAKLDDRLRDGPYTVPLPVGEEFALLSVVDVAARLAGVVLYENRGIVDMDPDGKPVHVLKHQAEYVNRWVAMVLAGQIRLEGLAYATQSPNVP